MNVTRKWSEIHRDHKVVIEGERFVLAYNSQTGGTELVPWKGPQ